MGRKRGIGAGIGRRLVSLGWDLALTHRSAYDKRMPWGRGGDETGEVVEELERRRKRFISEADLETTSAAEQIFRVVTKQLGPVTVLVLAHRESVNSGILDNGCIRERRFGKPEKKRCNWDSSEPERLLRR